MKHLNILIAFQFLAMPAAMAQKITKGIDSIAIKQLTPNVSQGPIDIITERQMNKGLVTNSLNALSGQAAGVNISSGENRMAQLNSVRVRGTTSLTGGNDPLVIIDGVYSDLATLSTVYPADIERFAILKNATETAKYGSRGASGVIQVTTKKGNGSLFHISYDGNIGFEINSKCCLHATTSALLSGSASSMLTEDITLISRMLLREQASFRTIMWPSVAVLPTATTVLRSA